MDIFTAAIALLIPCALVIIFVTSTLPTDVLAKGRRDEFPGRRQGGGGQSCIEQVDKKDEC